MKTWKTLEKKIISSSAILIHKNPYKTNMNIFMLLRPQGLKVNTPLSIMILSTKYWLSQPGKHFLLDKTSF